MQPKTISTTGLLSVSLCFFIFAFSNCKKDTEQFTVKGYLLQSCNNSEPVSGVTLQLTYPCKACPYAQTDFGSFTTRADGSFEFTYTSAKRVNELIISGTQRNGLGTLNYVYGIPINTTVNLGNVYATENFYALVKLNVQRPTSLADTIYYLKEANLLLPIIGPFTQGQVIDTLIYRNTQFYDKQNVKNYRNVPNAIITYKMGERGQYTNTGGLFDECVKYNEFLVDIK